MTMNLWSIDQAINLFVNSTNKFQECNPWNVFALKPSDWESVQDMRAVILDVNDIQQLFSDKHYGLEEQWDSLKYNQYCHAIQDSLNKINKYYNHLDDNPVYTIALIFYPYSKLDYIKMAWGTAEVIEDAMQDYWCDTKAEAAVVSVNCDVDSARTSQLSTNMLESEFDIHHCLLVEQANHTSSSMGCINSEEIQEIALQEYRKLYECDQEMLTSEWQGEVEIIEL
ncbi:hypothetical protein L210DRAFT_3503103 [Boletus edulis BED1]|uniref:Uncharacterized protein n=1 Tax=Boletus edulis BED1 TaxID=1328754 RepID=A0AAD4GGY4_BOLED|nr:hypothetical protein L210DRAFT_3508995 [Boletus edulis BED1]KAF8442030.1 hypothetical protein L210DRAFT_3503103 [Boletus edulis BED1]